LLARMAFLEQSVCTLEAAVCWAAVLASLVKVALPGLDLNAAGLALVLMDA